MSSALEKMLKSWPLRQNALHSPAFRDNKSYRSCKQMLTREWIHADCDDARRLIRVPISKTEEPGKSNHQKLVKMKVIVYV